MMQKLRTLICAGVGAVLLVGTAMVAPALEPDQRYYNTPDDMIPYRQHEPYLRFFLDSAGTGLEYTGPGREYPEPEGLRSVKIGYVGPLERVIPDEYGDMMPRQYFAIGQHMLRGATLAVEEANAAGGYRGELPFEIVTRNDPVVQVDFGWLWAPFSTNVVELCYDENVWALFGTIGGENSHILIRIALKVEIPIMNSADTDPTFPETRIPWLFRVISDDRMQCYVLAKYAYEARGWERVAVFRYNGRYGRVGTKEFREASRRLGHPVPIEVKFNNGESDFSDRLKAIQRVEPDAVFVWGNAEESARIVRQMRELGMNQPVLGSDRLTDPRFLEIAGDAAEGVVAASPWDPTADNPKLEAFRGRYEKRFGEQPETYAAHAYDGMVMLLEAIEEAGLNRALIRDALERRRKDIFHGVTGAIPLNDIYCDAGPIAVAKVQNGSWLYMSEQEAGVDLPRVVEMSDE
jgi:ABC-type branched-subunit amino acid transport system substrate-binding protein